VECVFVGVGVFWGNIYKGIFFIYIITVSKYVEGLMNMDVKFKFGLGFLSQRTGLFVSLFSSCTLIAMGADSSGVMSETELVSAINGAPSNVPTVITLGKDIILTTSLSIPAGKNITLASDGSNEFKLLGADGQSTIIVASGGILVLNGIVVTHVTNGAGSGVNVTSGGALILLSGRIFNNTDVEGGGVVNYGNFTMSGGAVLNNTKVMGGVVNYGNFTMSGSSSVIANNTVIDVEGDVYGGVLNLGIFRMSGGEIASNTDCGVSNAGNFTMFGGAVINNTDVMGGVVNYGNFVLSGSSSVITNNTSIDDVEEDISGGVLNFGAFRMSSGEISSNTFCGVSNFGNFTMAGGKILKNSVHGIFINHDGNFTMTGGEIFNNRADYGGGVYISSSFGTGTFIMSGGMIFNNTAADCGGGVYNSGSFFSISDDAVIANNTANIGGGVYTDGTFTMTGGVISNNTAVSGGGVYNNLGNFSMTKGEIFNNTATVDGGGVYNYGGNFTMSGGKISYNTAKRNGGGIGVPGLSGLAYVYVQDGATFSNNRAAAAYEIASADTAFYETHVGSKVTWTSPFKNGYNNYDIYYISNTQLDEDGKPIATASPSPTSTTSNTPRPTNTNTAPPVDPKDDFNWLAVGVVLVIGVLLIVAVLVFYLPKSGTKRAKTEEDLSDFTIV
jgi:hypothetical protein